MSTTAYDDQDNPEPPGYGYSVSDMACSNPPESGTANPCIQGVGMKHDAGKLQAGILFEDFPRALEAVLRVATFGANKYARSNWLTVPNAQQRYEDAMYRHLLAAGRDGMSALDAESGLLHRAHAAWNALATLELLLRQVEQQAEHQGQYLHCSWSALHQSYQQTLRELETAHNLHLRLKSANDRATQAERELAALLEMQYKILKEGEDAIEM